MRCDEIPASWQRRGRIAIVCYNARRLDCMPERMHNWMRGIGKDVEMVLGRRSGKEGEEKMRLRNQIDRRTQLPTWVSVAVINALDTRLFQSKKGKSFNALGAAAVDFGPHIRDVVGHKGLVCKGSK